MTPEQMEKAKEALADHRFRELKKRIMLHQYRQDMLNSKKWQLPFRMIHRNEYPPAEVPANDHYPHRSGITVDGSGKPVPIPDAQKITPETALYWFTRLLALNEANLTQYSPADWTGEAISAAEAAEIRETYLKRIRDYYDHPEKYNTEAQHGTGRKYFLPE